MDIIKNILNVTNNEYKYLLSLENVIGIGLGFKSINGINTREPCINVLVEKKVNKNFLTNNIIIPKDYKGLKTDVIEIGKCLISNGNAIPYTVRPLQGGCGISADVDLKIPGTLKTSGTLGCIVYKINENSKDFYILTNNHVISNNEKADIGTPIIQPSFLNNGNSKKNIIAYLTRYEPINSIEDNEDDENYVDCAIAQIYDRSLISTKIVGIGDITGHNVPELNMDVKKVGFISGLKTGFITRVGLTLKIRVINNKVSVLKEQCLLNINNEPGDSGCVVLNDDNEVVGLTFAATTNGYTIMNDINNVLEKLKVKIYANKKLNETLV